MKLLAKLFWLDVAILASAGLPIACANDGTNGKTEPAPEDPSVQAPDATVPDAAPDADAGTTSACSSSNLRAVQASEVVKDVKLTAIWGSGKNEVWAVGSGGTVLHYDGTQWEKAALAGASPEAGATYTLRSVWLERPDDVWFADGHGIRHSTGWKGPNATEWSFLSLPTDQCTPTSIRGIGGTVWVGRGLVLGWCPWQIGGFQAWSDVGPDYTTPRLADESAEIAIAATRPDEAWASFSWRPPVSGIAHQVIRLSLASNGGDGTPSWQTEELNSRSQLAMPAIWGDEHAVWLAGDGGTLRRLERAKMQAKAFEIVPSPVTTDLKGLFGFGANDLWAVGDDSTVIHWDGTSWVKLSTPFDDLEEKPNLVAVWGSSPDDVWIVGDGTMLHFQGNAQ